MRRRPCVFVAGLHFLGWGGANNGMSSACFHACCPSACSPAVHTCVSHASISFYGFGGVGWVEVSHNFSTHRSTVGHLMMFLVSKHHVILYSTKHTSYVCCATSRSFLLSIRKMYANLHRVLFYSTQATCVLR